MARVKTRLKAIEECPTIKKELKKMMNNFEINIILILFYTKCNNRNWLSFLKDDSLEVLMIYESFGKPESYCKNLIVIQMTILFQFWFVDYIIQKCLRQYN